MAILKDKVAVVTGGSRGIGAALVKALALEGAVVHFNYVSRPDKAQEVVTECERAGGICYSYQADVSKAEEVKNWMEHILAKFGKVDILINNAGITRDRSFRKMQVEEWQEVINVNLNSMYHVTQAVLPSMLEQNYGRVINISSIIGQTGAFGQSNYAASKSGMLGFTKSLALETAKQGITVNAICPGYIETEMVAAMPLEVLEQIKGKIPMKRLGKPEEIAQTVLFLLENEYITGQQLHINGGLYM